MSRNPLMKSQLQILWHIWLYQPAFPQKNFLYIYALIYSMREGDAQTLQLGLNIINFHYVVTFEPIKIGTRKAPHNV